MNAEIKPFLRWAGGKSWIIPFVRNLLSTISYNNYHEPFLGGGAVFFSQDIAHKSYLSDFNSKLIDVYKFVKKDHQRVYDYLKYMQNTKEEYYRIRSAVFTDDYERTAQFIYLNHNSYNGLYRVNRKGVYNVPYGFHKTFNYPITRLSMTSSFLKDCNAKIVKQDFEKAIKTVKTGDFVFLDPPYTVSHGKDNGFIEYNDKVFSLSDQERLAKNIEKINDVGAYFVLTNAMHPTILEIFKDVGFCINLERNSLIGGINARRGKIREYVFTNVEQGKRWKSI